MATEATDVLTPVGGTVASGRTLALAVRAVTQAVEPAEAFATYRGIQLRLTREALVVAATDGFTAARVRLPWAEPPELPAGEREVGIVLQRKLAQVAADQYLPQRGPLPVRIEWAQQVARIGDAAVPTYAGSPGAPLENLYRRARASERAVAAMSVASLRQRLRGAQPMIRNGLRCVWVVYHDPENVQCWGPEAPAADAIAECVQVAYLRRALQPLGARELVRVAWSPQLVALSAPLGDARDAYYEALIAVMFVK
jgi:hypothetical protein